MVRLLVALMIKYIKTEKKGKLHHLENNCSLDSQMFDLNLLYVHLKKFTNYLIQRWFGENKMIA